MNKRSPMTLRCGNVSKDIQIGRLRKQARWEASSIQYWARLTPFGQALWTISTICEPWDSIVPSVTTWKRDESQQRMRKLEQGGSLELDQRTRHSLISRCLTSHRTQQAADTTGD